MCFFSCNIFVKNGFHRSREVRVKNFNRINYIENRKLLKNNTKPIVFSLWQLCHTRQQKLGVDLLNPELRVFLCFLPWKTLDKFVYDFYIYLEFGERFFNQVVKTLHQSVIKNIKILLGKNTPNKNLSSKKRIAYEKHLLV